MQIKFTTDYAVKAEGGESYEIGQVVEMPRRSAFHFLNRGVAVEVEQPKKQAAAPKKREVKSKAKNVEESGSSSQPDPASTSTIFSESENAETDTAAE